MRGSSATTAPQRLPSALERDLAARRRSSVSARRRCPAIGLPCSLSSDCVDDGREVRVRAGQVVVQRPLEPGARARLRRVADDVRGEPALRVAAEVERPAARPSRSRFAREHASPSARRSSPRSIVNCATRWIALSCRSARPAAPTSASTSSRRSARRAAPTRPRARRVICRFTSAPAAATGAVRDEQQQREQDEVRDDARAAVGDERQRDPGQRDDAQDAADDDERLQREAEREPGREQLREAVVARAARPATRARRRA